MYNHYVAGLQILLATLQNYAQVIVKLKHSLVPAGWDSQQLQPLLKRLDDNTRALQSTLSSLRSLVQSSRTKAGLARQPSVAPAMTGGLWLPLLLAFVLGCCFGAFFQTWPRARLTFRKA